MLTHHAEEVAFDLADAELTRREALKRLGLLGLSATAAGALPAAFASDATALGRATINPKAAALALAPSAAPKPPPDIANGQGAWRMIDWGNLYEAFVDVPVWKSRGWGGFAVGYDYLAGYGGTQDFTPSSQLNNENPVYEVQRFIEYKSGASLPERCHANGCEAYIGTHFWNKTLIGKNLPPWGDWFNTKVRADVAAKFGRLAGFCKWIGMDGLKADTELGLWKGTDYSGNSHTADETRHEAYSWGLAIGTAIFSAHPSSKMLIYSWHPPGGWEDTFVYTQKSATATQTFFWMGYLEAMATHGDTDSRMIVMDAFFYKPSVGIAGVPTANAYKYHTQGSMAWLSKNLEPSVWNTVCDRIDMSLFSWAGTDSKDKAYYKHTGEPAFADQLALFRRYAMGTRRANYTYEGSPDRYCWIDHTQPAQEVPHHGFDQANNWYIINKEDGPNNAPGGHLPGLRAAARRKPIDTTPPTLTSKAPVDNRDGTFTVTGTAHHRDGIRCVRGFIHPKVSARVGAEMAFNPRGGTNLTNYDAATQDFTITVDATSHQYLMLTAVSIHDQEHSIAVPL